VFTSRPSAAPTCLRPREASSFTSSTRSHRRQNHRQFTLGLTPAQTRTNPDTSGLQSTLSYFPVAQDGRTFNSPFQDDASKLHPTRASPGRLTLWFISAPLALSLHKPRREPKASVPSPRLPAIALPSTPRRKLRQTWLPPVTLTCRIFKSAAPLRFLSRPLIRDPFPLRGRPAQTLRFAHGFEIHKRAGKLNGSVRLHANPKAMKPAGPARCRGDGR
jgi:hypothetical protein